ncbi:LPXTG cell wall anchor domain-containing protein [Paeniglutamicibacter sulfureus]|uniref:LPXTG-motif cell wall-anchored protein n=1 Tax=Paeniglutamicibacter sulfureus TaxID=43666 RepID=A0ABU2BCM8_9MICC|nr:LPXTG cell wall anchor domain-containing protein [Paeniglutamicibacter sulfureus]MDR7356363.1 LPXTG-motif cell wall-anchored protein [Paeniglutamicibacter sulfureus]
MHESSRALLKRGSIAAATTALVLGSSIATVPAIATTSVAPEPASTETSAVTSAESSQDQSQAALPSGLEAAVERDLGITIDEFYKNGELSSVVESLSEELGQSELAADFAIEENKIKVTVAASSLGAVTTKLDELTKGTDVELRIVTAPEAEATVAPKKVETKKAPKTKDPKAAPSKLPVIESPKTEATAKPEVVAKAMPKSAESLLEAYVQSVDPKAVSQLQAVMKTGSNSFVIRTGGTADVEGKNASETPKATALRFGEKMTPEEFAQQYTKVTIEKAEGPAKSAAAGDVLGGMGYGARTTGTAIALCSIGFSGFNADGGDAAISAGHCEQDGDITKVNIMEHTAPNKFAGIGAPLGTFGFSQFGGPGNSPVTGIDTATKVEDLGNVGTDISVIDNINPDLTLKSTVTDWKGADERDSGTKVTGVASAVIGAGICKSGRTTGWTCGTVDEVGIFLVGGYNGADDVRGVRGFGMANVGLKKANEGDSGGSAISGGTAVGVTSAVSSNDEGRAYFTDIKDGLKHAKGYSIALFLNAPAVASPSNGADVTAGSTISGTVAGAPSGSHVRVVSGGKLVKKATVTAGKFSFKVPEDFGTYDFTLQTVNGFNKSVTTAGSVNVVIGAPVITTPKNDATLNAPVSTISGTGVVGATVTLAGDATGTATVAADATWSVKLPTALSYGEYAISATQAKGGETSKATTSSFKVQLAAPAITGPANGKTFTEAQSVISGTGVAGATVKLTGAVTREVVVGKDGAWSVELQEGLSYGSHSITAVQNVGETTSTSVKSDFKVVPVAPSIDSPTDGQEFAFDEAPKTISGFGINGATIKVSLDGTELSSAVAANGNVAETADAASGEPEVAAVVVNGAWTVMVPEDLEAGDHKVTAVQVIDGVASAAISNTFTVAAAPKPEPTEEPTASPEPTQDSEPSKAPVVPQGEINGNDSGNGGNGGLANTGANAVLPIIAAGGALMVAGGFFMLLRRKNNSGLHSA